jgi:6-phosphogluconolactonase (cycloisomerase 2 family)
MKKTIVAILMTLVIVGSLSIASAASTDAVVAYYTSVGPTLSHYDLNVASGELAFKESVKLPVNVQFATVDPANQYMYVGLSNFVVGEKGKHFLSVFKIDQTTGQLQQIGTDLPLPERPINLAVDKSGKHLLIDYNRSATVEVYPIMADGTLGQVIVQPERPDPGIYPHQVRVTPDGGAAITVGRGNDMTATWPEDFGRLTVYSLHDGVMTQSQKLFMQPGIGPRHLDFHPTKPWVYVSCERGSKLLVYSLKNDTLSKEPLFVKEVLEDPTLANQRAGAIHVHPNGKFLYVSNRNDATVKNASGQSVLVGGENNIAVYAIDQVTGEPTAIQHIDTHGIEARTVVIDPSGHILIVANQEQRTAADGTVIPRSMAVFTIGEDGMLTFVRKYDVQDQGQELFWSGLVALGGSKYSMW